MFCIHTLFQAEGLFLLSAVVGSLFFILKILLFFIGLGAHAMHLDFWADHHDVDGHDSDIAFKSLSITSICGFLMMFGWVGLAAYVQHDKPLSVSVGMALMAGIVLSGIVALIGKGSLRCINPGTVFHAADTVGKEAVVYQAIPARGVGRITVVVKDMSREIDAVSHNHVVIPSFTPVIVVSIINSDVVSVKKIEN